MNMVLRRNKGNWLRGAAALLFLSVAGVLLMAPVVLADPHPGQSQNVVIIGGPTVSDTCSYISDANYVINGGCLPVEGPAGELGDFTFAGLAVAAVSAANLAPYDTAVLNVASYSYVSPGIICNMNNLTPAQKADIVNFVAAGKKLIIYDSECSPQDYNWLPYPFQTSNPGALGAFGTATIVEDNFLSTLVGDPTCTSGDVHCINVSYLGASTDAIGDMNVMTTFDPNWCVDMSGTNAIGTTGPVHTYAKYPAGTDSGLIIYNGLDVDYLYPTSTSTASNLLRKIWVQELQQPFNPSNLPCGVTVVGISISPATASNPVGEEHTVTARIADLLNTPAPGIAVTITVTSGPNAGTSLTGNTDADGEFSLTYTGDGGVGIDQIQACFNNQAGDEICSQLVSKEWVGIQASCDVDGDGDVDRYDIAIMNTARGTSNPAYDIDGDGTVTVADMRTCSLQCTNPRCAP